jgi:hypothetical protein
VRDVLTVWLSDCRADDRKAISCRECTKCYEHNDPQVESVHNVLASQANHLGELVRCGRQITTLRRN